MAKFCAARVVGRQVGSDAAAKVEHMKASLHTFEEVLKLGRAASEGVRSAFDSELSICAEMAELLPSKINSAHYKGTRFS